MDKAQLISMIHFLEKRDEASKKENEELKELLKSLRAEYREDAELTQKLLKTIESLTQQVAEITAENKKLQQQIDELLKQI
jgi:thiamine kinase-like enzyme